MTKKPFSIIPIGGLFTFNGNLCEKRSTRTALLKQYGRIFYIGKNDLVSS